MWIYVKDGKKIGPISFDEIVKRILNGDIVSQTAVCIVGERPYRAVNHPKLKEYFSSANQTESQDIAAANIPNLSEPMWLYSHNGHKVGPVAYEEIVNQINAEIIEPSTPVCCVGEKPCRAATHPKLKPIFDNIGTNNPIQKTDEKVQYRFQLNLSEPSHKAQDFSQLGDIPGTSIKRSSLNRKHHVHNKKKNNQKFGFSLFLLLGGALILTLFIIIGFQTNDDSLQTNNDAPQTSGNRSVNNNDRRYDNNRQNEIQAFYDKIKSENNANRINAEKSGKALIILDNVKELAKDADDYLPGYYDNSSRAAKSNCLFWRCFFDREYFDNLKYGYYRDKEHLINKLENQQSSILSEIKRNGIILRVPGYDFHFYGLIDNNNPNQVTFSVEYDPNYAKFHFNYKSSQLNSENLSNFQNIMSFLRKDFYHILMKDGSFSSVPIPNDTRQSMYLDSDIRMLQRQDAMIYYDDKVAEYRLKMTLTASPKIIEDFYRHPNHYCMEFYIEHVTYEQSIPVVMYRIDYVNENQDDIDVDTVNYQSKYTTIQSNGVKEDVIGGEIVAFQIRNLKTNKIIASANVSGTPIRTKVVGNDQVVE